MKSPHPQLLAFLRTRNERNNRHAWRFLQRATWFFVLFGLGTWLYPAFTSSAYGYAYVSSDGFVHSVTWPIFALFIVLLWPIIKTSPLIPRNVKKTWIYSLVAIALLAAPLPWIAGASREIGYLLYIAQIIVATVCMAIAIFTPLFFRQFHKELALLLVAIIPLQVAPFVIDTFWEYSSRITLTGLSWILPLIQVPHDIEMASYEVQIESFGVIVGPPCAGILSLSTFSALYVIALAFGSRTMTFSTPKVIMAYIFGLIGTFFLNTMRVLLILLLGAYYDPEFAIGAFHESAGAILFLLFFVLYSWKLLPRLRTQTNTSPKKH